MKNNFYIKTVKRILKTIGSHRWGIFASLLFGAATVVCSLYIPILTGRAIDFVIGEGQVDFAALKYTLIEMAAFIGAAAFFQWLMSDINNRIAYNVVKDIRVQAFAKLEKLPVKYIDSHGHGDIISRMTADVDQFSDGLIMGFAQLFTGVLSILCTLFFMFSINPIIAAAVAAITPVSLFTAAFIAKRTFSMFREQSKARGELATLVEETLRNEKTVQAFGQEKNLQERFEETDEELRKWSLKATFFSSITNPSTRFVNSLVYSCVGITGAFSAIRGYLSVGQLTSFLNYARQYTKPFNEISGVIAELQNALACAARVYELIDEEPVPPDDANAEELAAASGNISFKNVSFSYDSKKPLIQGMDIEVPAGKHVALAGPTGCGKTTLINLIMRFYDVDSGAVCIDGKDIRGVKRASLRREYGLVLQDTWLKAGTIKENIAFGKPDASDEEIIQAAKDARAHGFIKKMKDGYDTVVGEDGGNLSEGQRQLLSIARVMLCKPKVLLLDEATSSIDTRTEINIQKAFAKMAKGRTSIVVAHRLSTIREADVILVMKDGRIIERGDHETLIKAGGFYEKLYNSQFAV